MAAKTKLVVYQLEDYDADYEAISVYLKKRLECEKIMQRVWIVKTTKSTAAITNGLSKVVSSPARILVVDITDSVWGSYGISIDKVAWMQEII
jgi:hypothetical protein